MNKHFLTHWRSPFIGVCSCGQKFRACDLRHPGHNRDFSLTVEEKLGVKDKVS